MERDGAWAASFDLPYPSAASLLASLPDGTWLAVARHDADDDPQADRFFGDLFCAPAPASAAPSPKRAAGLGPRQAAALGLISGSAAISAIALGRSMPRVSTSPTRSTIGSPSGAPRTSTAPRATYAIETDADCARHA